MRAAEARSGSRILLTTVCQPYGLDGCEAEAAGMQMELLNNQVTREQGVHSPRANYWTFPLYFLAENISVPATVLDFPSWGGFVRELRRGYAHVGISFIQTNVLKAQRMARYVRAHHPQVRILLGGYGAAQPDLRELVPCDAICAGEGIAWLRRYFGDDPGAPIRHPVLQGVAQKHLYGFPAAADGSAVLFPGLGCPNSCFFCSTSSKFKGRYIPILKTGREMFEACRAAEDRFGVREFAVIDENFPKDPARARELLAEQERHRKAYSFFIFSSAEALTALGADFLVRLGVGGVWMGVESSAAIFAKTRGVDPAHLIRELQSRGISLISSSILFMEHHDHRTLDDDVEWAIGLGSDMHQFMQLTPLPGTPLYEEYRKRGLLIPRFPYTKMSGQNVLNFYHEHFRSEEARQITRLAFRRKYERDGPAVVNMAWTALHGYERAVRDDAARRREGRAWNAGTLQYDRTGLGADPYMQARVEVLRRRAATLRPILAAAWLFSPNAAARGKCRTLMRKYREVLGPPRRADGVRSGVLVASAIAECARMAASRLAGRGELLRQPRTRRIEYRTPASRAVAAARAACRQEAEIHA